MFISWDLFFSLSLSRSEMFFFWLLQLTRDGIPQLVGTAPSCSCCGARKIFVVLAWFSSIETLFLSGNGRMWEIHDHYHPTPAGRRGHFLWLTLQCCNNRHFSPVKPRRGEWIVSLNPAPRIDSIWDLGRKLNNLATFLIFFFFLFNFDDHFYFPAQLVGGFTLSVLLDKPWSQVSSLSPPGACLQFLSRIGFSIPTARRFLSNVANSRSRAFR